MGADPKAVFLNIPFDQDYEALYVALIGGLVGLGLAPRCVLEIPDGGDGRLARIIGLIASCGASVHDLSRVSRSGGVPRFNMPFELGLAHGLRSTTEFREHRAFVFEEERYRLQRSLSDTNGIDPLIHEAKPHLVVARLLDCFGNPSHTPSRTKLTGLVDELMAQKRRIRKSAGGSLFSGSGFKQLVYAAVVIARSRNLVR